MVFLDTHQNEAIITVVRSSFFTRAVSVSESLHDCIPREQCGKGTRQKGALAVVVSLSQRPLRNRYGRPFNLILTPKNAR